MLYLPNEEGQGLVEYALIIVLVAIVVIAVLTLLGGQLQNVFNRITNALAPQAIDEPDDEVLAPIPSLQPHHQRACAAWLAATYHG